MIDAIDTVNYVKQYNEININAPEKLKKTYC